MAFEHYIQSGMKRLRCGYTTGTCATLAALGAARLLLTGTADETAAIVTPKGLRVSVDLEDLRWLDQATTCCAVRKDAGDDADVTDGLLVYATVARCAAGLVIDGGEGVGRVTKPGLDQPIGAAAINHVPRKMIAEALQIVCEAVGYTEGLLVTISVPGGAEAAQKTFNPQLGIVGGISILGSSGIVEPMSEAALLETIALQQAQAYALGARRLIVTPGNFGQHFLQAFDTADIPIIKCSNFIGETLDLAGKRGFEAVLLVGHIGKLVKLAGGIFNTHSRYADCRRELFCAHAALCGADTALCQTLMDCATTEACLHCLEAVGLREQVTERLLEEIARQVRRRASGRFSTDVVLYATDYGLLGKTAGANEWGEFQ